MLWRTRLHWSMFILPLLFLVWGISGAGIPESWESALIALFGFGWLCKAGLQWTTTGVELTAQQLTLQTGILRRRRSVMPLPKIESVNVEQPLLGRILGYGTVVVSGTGGSALVLAGIGQPAALAEALEAALPE